MGCLLIAYSVFRHDLALALKPESEEPTAGIKRDDEESICCDVDSGRGGTNLERTCA